MVASVLALAAVVSVGTQWASKNADALTDRPNDSYYQALHYVEENLDRRSPILVDDSYWNPLVDAGMEQRRLARCHLVLQARPRPGGP